MATDNALRGDTLKKLRRELGYSVEKIIQIVNIGDTTYNRIEAGGNCRADTLETIVTEGLGMRMSSFYRIIETAEHGGTTENKDDEILANYLTALTHSITELNKAQSALVENLGESTESTHLQRALSNMAK